MMRIHQHNILHLVLALMLATWSPAWCQCVLLVKLRSSASQACADTTHLLADACGESSPAGCCEEHNCCPVSADSKAQHAGPMTFNCCPSQCNDVSDGADCTCPCCDQVLVATSAASDNSADVMVDRIGMPAIWLDHGGWRGQSMTHPAATAGACRHGPPRSGPPTLLAQRCLLQV